MPYTRGSSGPAPEPQFSKNGLGLAPELQSVEAEVLQRELRYGHVAVELNQTAQEPKISRAQRLALFDALQLGAVPLDLVGRAVLLDQLRGGANAHARDALHVVGRITDQHLDLSDLAGRYAPACSHVLLARELV